VTLYEAASGKRPFEADTLVALTHKVVHDPVPPAPVLPPFLQGILARAMEKDPDGRYTDASAMATDLQRQQVSPPPAPRPGHWPAPPPPARLLTGELPPTPGWHPPPAPSPLLADRHAPTLLGDWPSDAAPLAPYADPVPLIPRDPPDIRALIGNTSGMGSSQLVPPEIARGWNWGAFGLTPLWGIAHNTWLALLCFSVFLCPPFGILTWGIVALIMGAFGNQWAWQNRRWQSVEQFYEVQRKWALWGLATSGVGLLFFIFAVLYWLLRQG